MFTLCFGRVLTLFLGFFHLGPVKKRGGGACVWLCVGTVPFGFRAFGQEKCSFHFLGCHFTTISWVFVGASISFSLFIMLDLLGKLGYAILGPPWAHICEPRSF